MEKFYAHTDPENPHKLPEDGARWQELKDHLEQTARLAKDFASTFNSGHWGYTAGTLHDLGKYSAAFQAYLLRENGLDDSGYDCSGVGKVNHSSAGAAYAEEFFNIDHIPYGRILAYLIAGHHAGLPDYHTCDGGRGALRERLEEGKTDLEKIRPQIGAIMPSQSQIVKLPDYVNKKNFHFWVRFLFSCLVDADFLDTEAFMSPEQSRMRDNRISLKTLKTALDQHMIELTNRCLNTTEVNRIRHEVLQACRTAAKEDSGLFSLTVPTGGGKTLAAMSFALDHAVLHDKTRIIYVIPYTSIIEQTATTLREVFGTENVVEHHSNLDPEKETLRTRLASENWEAPIIVTTNVQFYESLFAARSSRCRKLHNIIKSIVILDEAQLLPPKLLSPCVSAINELVQEHYGVTVVLSTATQPALPSLVKAKNIIPKNLNLYERLERTRIQFPEDMRGVTEWEDVAAKLLKHDQVLCIVNTRRNCYDLFQCVSQLVTEGTIHLSALMCGEHRSATIETIKNQLNASKPVRVISTQLVEAGVDIDFPVVYRALAGLDSIAQAAGRCNREGKLNQQGDVVVFVPPHPSPRGLLHKGECTTRELHKLPHFNAQCPSMYTRYFDLFYSKVNDTGEKYLRDLTPSDTALLDVSFRSVGDTFRLIDDQDSRPVFVQYAKGEELIESLKRYGPNRTLLRKLQRYTVNLNAKLAEKMKGDGLLEEVWPGFLAQVSRSLYDDLIGLNIFRDGWPVEDLVGV